MNRLPAVYRAGGGGRAEGAALNLGRAPKGEARQRTSITSAPRAALSAQTAPGSHGGKEEEGGGGLVGEEFGWHGRTIKAYY